MPFGNLFLLWILSFQLKKPVKMQNVKSQKKKAAGGLDQVINLTSPRLAGLTWPGVVWVWF